MVKSVFTASYDDFRTLLIGARRASGLTQVELAESLKKPQSFVSKYESGERRIDVVEFLEICAVLSADPLVLLGRLLPSGGQAAKQAQSPTLLDLWKFTADDLTHLANDNPSLRGILLGYLAELKLEQLLTANPDVTSCTKYDDHDRKKKGDRVVTYKGRDYTAEVKSLQTNSIRVVANRRVGKVQVDASDRRQVTLPGGSKVNTTCLLTGEFDMLTVNLFAFEQDWRFIFARNSDLPRSTFKKYTAKQRKHLLATLVEVSWPPEPPFYDDPFRVLDEIARGRNV